MPDLISTSVAWFLAWLFSLAALHKFRAADHYLDLLTNYLPVLPRSRVLVRLISVGELGLALALIASATQRAALIASALLLLVYAAMMLTLLLRGQTQAKCGCAGPNSDVFVSSSLVVRNLICSAVALMVVLAPSQVIDAGFSATTLTALISCFFAFVYLCCEQLISNGQRMSGKRMSSRR